MYAHFEVSKHWKRLMEMTKYKIHFMALAFCQQELICLLGDSSKEKMYYRDSDITLHIFLTSSPSGS